MKKSYIPLFTLVATGLILTACGNKPEEIKVYGDGDAAEVINYSQTNCEKSGGSFVDGSCTCATNYTYNEKSGLCTDENATPGGDMGIEVKNMTNIKVQ